MISKNLDTVLGSSTPSSSDGGRYIKSTIYGGLDGIITTFAVVAGVAGASLSSGIVLILGFANLLADGISMAIGDYLSTKAEVEYADSKRQIEAEAIDENPGDVKKELTSLFVDKGITEEDAEILESIYARYKHICLDVVMLEKWGVVKEKESPVMNALVTFASFVLFGFMPLAAYLAAHYIPALGAHTFLVASVITALTLFILGVQKIRFSDRSWLASGFEMLIIGGVAAVVAYAIGVLLSGIA
ncbi:MAG: VIT1/CCC1 transporter family protein [Rhodothermaceae bacterium]|nr:VIT1/CCC1 transporter family protein [Rhodothermaceae bacterium]